MKMIKAVNVSKGFCSGSRIVQVLSDISFNLEKGSVLTLIGKSGMRIKPFVLWMEK